MWEYIGPAFDTVGGALTGLKTAWNTLTGATNDSGDADEQLDERLADARRGPGHDHRRRGRGDHAGLRRAASRSSPRSSGSVNAVKDAFVIAGTWIGETAAKIYLWFTETLPAAISSAIDGDGRLLPRHRQLLRGHRPLVLEPLQHHRRGHQELLPARRGLLRRHRPDHQVGLRRRSATSCIKLLRKIPDALLPASLERAEAHAAVVGGTDRGRVRRGAAHPGHGGPLRSRDVGDARRRETRRRAWTSSRSSRPNIDGLRERAGEGQGPGAAVHGERAGGRRDGRPGGQRRPAVERCAGPSRRCRRTGGHHGHRASRRQTASLLRWST
ncbi:MAG: hypothetical protein MZV63_31805 [Marinilabiliales bacterium]|nr:hypothetical protein [Marinilabiliales bacterium]